MSNDARPGLNNLGLTDGGPTDDQINLPTRAEIRARADHAFYSVAQTFLSEFEGTVELYPEDDSARQHSGDPHVYETNDGRQVAVDGGDLCDNKFCGQPATTSVTRKKGALTETTHYCDTHGSHLEIDA